MLMEWEMETGYFGIKYKGQSEIKAQALPSFRSPIS